MDIEKMTIEEIINHPRFYQLKRFQYGEYETGPAYFEIQFECEKQDEHGRWITPFGFLSPYKYHMVYKLIKG